MGLPEILIEFKTKAQTAVTRSQNGIVELDYCTESGKKDIQSGFALFCGK